VFVCVVDPGVGSVRDAVIVEVGGRYFVGPDNGLLAMIVRRSAAVSAWRITWAPEHLSSSFHGRDLFAPVAAMLARGEAPPGEPLSPDMIDRADWPDELARIVYVDRYGNLVSGYRAAGIDQAQTVAAGGRTIAHGDTFSAVPAGAAFWYANSNGLIEIAVNQGRADAVLKLDVGAPITIGDRG
jgi:hypothetical protein